MQLNEMAKIVHDLAVEKGWWSQENSIGNQISNLHAEVSEAWEEYRSGRSPNEIYFSQNRKPEGIPIELADLIIRVLDLCANQDIDIEAAIKLKHEYNKTRPYRHGGKIA